jgi:DNA-binding MarR family transcriptional regulator
MKVSSDLNLSDYRALAEFRYQLRRFLHFSEEAARAVGLEPQHHQLMLAVKGMPEGRVARIAELAERLQLQHHSVGELVNRLAAKGLIKRSRESQDRREVQVILTTRGERLLAALSVDMQTELKSAGPELVTALRRISLRSRPRNANTRQVRTRSQSRDGGGK